MRLPPKRRMHRRLSEAQRAALIGAYSALRADARIAASEGLTRYARLLAERARTLAVAFTKPVPRRSA